MNIIGIILFIIFGAGTQTGRKATGYTLEQANTFYYRLIRFILILIVFIAIGWACSRFFGFRSINTLFALMFILMAIIVGFQPIIIAIAGVAGGILEAFQREGRGFSVGMERFLKNLAGALYNALAWCVFIFIILRYIPFDEYPLMFFWDVLALVIFYKILCRGWNFQGRLATILIVRGTQLAMACYVFIIISSLISLKVFGYDMGSVLAISDSDIAIKKASESLQKSEVAEIKELIEDLRTKVEMKKATPEEKDELQKLIRDASIFGKASAFVKNGLSELEEFKKEKEAKEAKKKALEDTRKKLETSENHLSDTSDPTAAIPVLEITPKKLVAEFDSAINLNCKNCSQRIHLGGNGVNLGSGKYYISPRAEVVLHFIGKEGGFKKSGSDGSVVVPDGTEWIGVRSNQPGKIFPEKI